MTLSALVLVLTAAVFHATWNLLAKRVGSGGAIFVWLFSAVSVAVYAPLVAGLLFFVRPHIGPVEIAFMVGSGVLHLGYFVLLQRGYAVGDLSVVYPLARGTGPLLASFAAVVFFSERPTVLAVTGIASIAVGVLLLTGNRESARSSGLGRGVVYGLVTGVFIAAYTLWDKHAVSALLIPPLLMSWATTVAETVLLAPLAIRSWGKTLATWRFYRLEVLGVARAQSTFVYPGPHCTGIHSRELCGPGTRDLYSHRRRHGRPSARRRKRFATASSLRRDGSGSRSPGARLRS